MGFSALSLISMVSKGPPVIIYLINVVFILIWSAIMQFLCLKGLSMFAWLFLVVGIVLSMLIVFYVIVFIASANKMVKDKI
jgi:hypothetical protein